MPAWSCTRRFPIASSLRRWCRRWSSKGRLGQKSGRGFFSYQNKKGRAEDDPAVEKLIAPYRRGERKFSREELTNRLFLPMLLEATRMLEEKIVRDVRDVDLGLIFGLGFPPFKGGLLYWADTIGAAKLLEMIKPLEPLGARFQPTPLLRRWPQAGESFIQNSTGPNLVTVIE